ncbi:BTAD domain-containing putative transcriptional regulator [Kitasatospora sp. NPDC057692]|uniref:AfsR/SARP family transcriptional regulator n=1 Tax=Kitasatospora sp. NPDC057692 TaxID=3346215 RepID=UPI0036ADA4FA
MDFRPVGFQLSGEIEVRSAGRLLDVGTPRQQVVLAALLVDARRPITIEALVDRVWGHAPPANPRPVLYAHLSRIRGLLRQTAAPDGGTAARIERRHAGYVLDVDPDLVDLHRFRRLVEQAHDRQHDDEARSATLAEALHLWRGEPLAGLSGDWAAQIRASWHQRRLDAAVRWARTELRLGRPTAVISTVPDLTTEYPLAEPLEHVLIQALHAAGREAEALDRYGTVRRRLAEELGAGPGRELRTLYRTVLIGDPPPKAAVPRPPRQPRPAPPPPADPTTASNPKRVSTPHRRALLTLLAAVLLPAAASAHVLGRATCDRPETDDPSPAPVERAQELFAAAEALDRENNPQDARTTTADATQLWADLITLDPDRNAPPLAPTVLQALARSGVDFSVPRPALLSWLANPLHTPYPAISQAILLHGWRFTAPVFLDAIVWNYEHTPDHPSPRTLPEVHTPTLKAAILEHTRTRHGTHPTDFDQLLPP